MAEKHCIPQLGLPENAGRRLRYVPIQKLGVASEPNAISNEQLADSLQYSGSNHTPWEPRYSDQGLFIKPIRRRKCQEYATEESSSYPSSWTADTFQLVEAALQKFTSKPDSRSSLQLRPSFPIPQNSQGFMSTGILPMADHHKRSVPSRDRSKTVSNQTVDLSGPSDGRSSDGNTSSDSRLKAEGEAYDPDQRLKQIEKVSSPPANRQRDRNVKRCHANCTLSSQHYYICNEEELPADQDDSEMEWATHEYANNGRGQPGRDWQSSYSTLMEEQTELGDFLCKSCLRNMSEGNGISQASARKGQPEPETNSSASSIQRPEDRQLPMPSHEPDWAPYTKRTQDSFQSSQASESVISDTEAKLPTPFAGNRSEPPTKQRQTMTTTAMPREDVFVENSIYESYDTSVKTESETSSCKCTSFFVLNQSYFEGAAMPQFPIRMRKACPCTCPKCGSIIQKFLKEAKNTNTSEESGYKMDQRQGINSRASRPKFSNSLNSFSMPGSSQSEGFFEEPDSRQCRVCNAILQRSQHQCGGTENNFANQCRGNMIAANANANHPVGSHVVDEHSSVDQIIEILYEKVSQLKRQRNVPKPFLVNPVVGQRQNSLDPVPDNRHAWQPYQMPATPATYAPQPEQLVPLSSMDYHWAKQTNQPQAYSSIAANPYPQRELYIQPYEPYGRPPAPNELKFDPNRLPKPVGMFNPAQYGYHVLNPPDYPAVDVHQNYDSVNRDPSRLMPGQKYFQGTQAGRVQTERFYNRKRESSGFDRASLFQEVNSHPYPELYYEFDSNGRHPYKPEEGSYYIMPNMQRMPPKPPLQNNTEYYPDSTSRCLACPTHDLMKSPSISLNSIYSNPSQEKKRQKKHSTVRLKGTRKLSLKFNLSKWGRNVQAKARHKVSVLKSRSDEINASLSSSQSEVNNVPVDTQSNVLISKSPATENNEEVIDRKEPLKGETGEIAYPLVSKSNHLPMKICEIEKRENNDYSLCKIYNSGNTLASGQNRFDESPLKVAHSVTSVSKMQLRKRSLMELMLTEKTNLLRSIKFVLNLIKPELETKIYESKQYRYALKAMHSDIQSFADKRIPQMEFKCTEKNRSILSEQCCRDDITVLFDSKYKFLKSCEVDMNIDSEQNFKKHSTFK